MPFVGNHITEEDPTMSTSTASAQNVGDTPEDALALANFVAQLTSVGITKMACADMFEKHPNELRRYLRAVAYCLRHPTVEQAKRCLADLRQPMMVLLTGYAVNGLGGQTPDMFLTQFEISCCNSAEVTPPASARQLTADPVMA